MELKTIIFNSELEFRKYVILNSKLISQIIVFEDAPDHTIFFYLFVQKGLIIATKEPSSKNFSYYRKIYERLANEFGFNIVPNHYQFGAIRMVK